jgi:hypothetical protein
MRKFDHGEIRFEAGGSLRALFPTVDLEVERGFSGRHIYRSADSSATHPNTDAGGHIGVCLQ